MKAKVRVVGVKHDDYGEGDNYVRTTPLNEIECCLRHDRDNKYDVNAVCFVVNDVLMAGHVCWLDLPLIGHLDDDVEARMLRVDERSYLIEVEIANPKPLLTTVKPIELEKEFLIDIPDEDKKQQGRMNAVRRALDAWKVEPTDQTLQRLRSKISLFRKNYHPTFIREYLTFISMMTNETALMAEQHAGQTEMAEWHSFFSCLKGELTQLDMKKSICQSYMEMAERWGEQIGSRYYKNCCVKYAHTPLRDELMAERKSLGQRLADYMRMDCNGPEDIARVLAYRFVTMDELRAFLSCRVIEEYLREKMEGTIDVNATMMSDERIKENILAFMSGNVKKNKRWWFPVYRVLKDAGRVPDLGAFGSYLQQLFDDTLPLPIDTNELSKNVEVMSFSRPFSQWDRNNAPFKGKVYENYYELTKNFKNMFNA